MRPGECRGSVTLGGVTSRTLILGSLLALASSAQAAVQLPNVNCNADAGNVRCTLKTSARDYGLIGEGTPFSLGGFTDSVGTGFVDVSENALYVPFEAGGQMDNLGGVVRVDLKTGNRTLVSGKISDLEERGKGLTYINDRNQNATAWGLGRVLAVRPGPGGSLYALSNFGSSYRTEIVRIDKATGNRTIVWANRLADDASHSSRADTIQNQEAALGIREATLCNRAPANPSSFEVYGGNLYVGSNGGVLKIVPGVSCTWISQYEKDGTVLKGDGPAVKVSVLTGTSLAGNELTLTTGPGATWLTATNLDTGTRRVISGFDQGRPRQGPGTGEAYIGYLGTHAAGQNVIATTGYTSITDFTATVVDRKTGNRTVIEGKGSLKRGRTSNMNIVANIPGTDTFIVWYERALHVWDARTGDAYILSQ